MYLKHKVNLSFENTTFLAVDAWPLRVLKLYRRIYNFRVFVFSHKGYKSQHSAAFALFTHSLHSLSQARHQRIFDLKFRFCCKTCKNYHIHLCSTHFIYTDVLFC